MNKIPILKRLVPSLLLPFLLTVCFGQRRWDGGAGDGQWNSPANWYPDGTPSDTEDVLLDNSLLPSSYSVILPDGSAGIRLNSLHIQPAAPMGITLTIPATNTAAPALAMASLSDPIMLGAGALLRNASGAASGEVIALLGPMSILDGGHYVHQTARSNATLINHLSHAPGTERGVFEFDVPGTSGYTVSLTGNTFGTLMFSSTTAGGAKSYSGSGVSNLQVRGNLQVNAGTQLTSTLSADILIGASLLVNGTFILQPPTTGLTGRSLVFSGSAAAIGGTGTITLGSRFRNIEADTSSSVTLDRDIDLPNAGQSFLVRSAAVLRMGMHLVGGAGGFVPEEGCTLHIGHPSGITTGNDGNVRTALRQFPSKAAYIYDGTGAQGTGNALPASLDVLGVDKPSGALTLTSPVESAELRLQRGNILTAGALLTLSEGKVTSPMDAYGRTDEGWEASHVVGPLSIRSSSAGTKAFPVGDTLVFAPVVLDKVGPGLVTYTVSFHPQALTPPASTSPALDTVQTTEYWSITSSGTSPAHDAKLSLSWRKTSGVGKDTAERRTLRIAGLEAMANGWQWTQQGSSFLTEGDSSQGWIHSGSPVTSFQAFTFATASAAGILPLLPWLRCHGTGIGNLLEWDGAPKGPGILTVVEKSQDGIHFVRLPSRVAEDMSFIDADAGPGLNFYRLRVADDLDSMQYSNTCRVQSPANTGIRIHPVPARDRIWIRTPLVLSGCSYRIVHQQGGIVHTGTLPDGNDWSIPLYNMAPGYYVLELEYRGGRFTKPFLKR
jgi:hypothetical protein